MSPNDLSYDKSYFLTPFSSIEMKPRREKKRNNTNDRGKVVEEETNGGESFSPPLRLVFSNAWVGSLDREEAERLKRRGWWWDG